MKKSVLVSAVLLAVNGQVFAESQLNLDDVIVTATRTPQSREAVIADVSVINAEEIEKSGQFTLVELLRLQQGIEISQTGGAGQSSALFMRGTNSNHVVVLIDGMRLNSATLGTTTLENIQLSQIERIEILRGPATSLYGQDAIGGVVQLFTKKGSDGFHPHFNIGYGSFGTKLAEAGVHGQFEDTRYAVSLSGKKVDGFSALEQELAIIDDDDAYRSWQLSANVSQKLAEGHEIGLQIFNSDGKVEYDNRYNTTDYNSRTYMVQQAFSAFSKNQFTQGWLSTLRVGLSRDRQKNYDESPAFSRFDTEQTQINWQNDLKLPVGTLTLMYDRLEDEVTSSTDFSTQSRVNDGWVASYIGTLGAHTLQASYRNDQNEQYGHYDTGNLGYGYQVSSVFKVSANLGTALKAPTFNDLYFPFSDFGFGFSYSGNPELKPERSFNKEISAVYDDGAHRFSVTAYHNKIKDLIVGTQGLMADSPINLNEVTIKGLSLAANHQAGAWLAGLTVDIQSPRNDETDNLLIRRANHHATAYFNYSYDRWQWGAELIASGKRYEDSANTRTLAGYAVLNLTGQYNIDNDWTLQARLNNLLDKDYALASNGFPPSYPYIDYNTPRANLFVNIRYQPK